MTNTTALDLNRQRAEFEAWHRQYFPDVEFKLLLGAYAVISMTPRPHGSFAVNERWKAWQAATQQAAREQQEPVAYFQWWTSIETDVRKSMVLWAQRETERLHALVKLAYEAGQTNGTLYAAPVAQQSEAGEILPCPFCGGKCDPKGWLGGGGSNGAPEVRGPECEQCGATADTVEDWNRRASQPTEAGAPTVAAISAPEFPKFNTDGLEGSMSPPDLWDYACLVGYRCAAPTSGRESAAPAAPVDREGAQQDALEKLIAQHRIAITPEYEGGFHAHIHNDQDTPQAYGYGKTPRAAVDAAMQKGPSNG